MTRPKDMPLLYRHGMRARYVTGCRCPKCRQANSRYQTLREKEIRAGRGNPLVPADRARQHMLMLSDAGVGRRAVQTASGVALTVLQGIRAGTRLQCRRQTEAKILAVNATHRSGGALVPAGPTYSRLKTMLMGGYTKTALAKALGSDAKVPSLQIISDTLVTQATERRVLEFFRAWIARQYRLS